MKTGLCQFSGFKIHPGHGVRYVRLDSKSFTFVDAKSESLFLHKRNPRKIRWTQVYRRMHKKGTSAEELAKKKARRPQKLQRAIVGASLEVLKQKRNQKPEVRSAQREAALREIKERKKKQKEAKAANKASSSKSDKKAQATKSKATTGKDKGRK